MWCWWCRVVRFSLITFTHRRPINDFSTAAKIFARALIKITIYADILSLSWELNGMWSFRMHTTSMKYIEGEKNWQFYTIWQSQGREADEHGGRGRETEDSAGKKKDGKTQNSEKTFPPKTDEGDDNLLLLEKFPLCVGRNLTLFPSEVNTIFGCLQKFRISTICRALAYSRL